MGIGSFLEPLVVVTLLFGGAWFNRNKDYSLMSGKPGWMRASVYKKSDDAGLHRSDSTDSLSSSPSTTSIIDFHHEPKLRRRKFKFFGYTRIVSTPNTLVFKDRFLSRVLQKFPFLTEAWYWVNVYLAYEAGRAFTALTLVEETVNVARKHALQVVHVEQQLLIFCELPIQTWFLDHPAILHWINCLYSFIHIPGTIFFLVVLFYLTTTRKRHDMASHVTSDTFTAGPALYEARRRSMAMCNLIAFVIFTLWPCMPPRLLSDPDYNGSDAAESKSFGFVDTVHSGSGESSVWTTNKFCNQYAAMPSLHFGYSLLIGLTVATLPINGLRPTSWKRIAIVALGLFYPTLILTAIIATANHFILDAVAGAMVCGLAWYGNDALLNLCILEDYFLALVRIHKPVHYTDPETAVEPEFQVLFSEEA